MNVKTELAPVAGLGENDAVMPFGGGVFVLRETDPLNPPVGVMLMVVVPMPPRGALTLLGLAERLKSPVEGALTTRVTVVE